MNVKMSLPLLPLRDIVVFPSMVIPLFVGRDKSINALNNVMNTEKKILLVTQKNSETDDPKRNDIFNYGLGNMSSVTTGFNMVWQHEFGHDSLLYGFWAT